MIGRKRRDGIVTLTGSVATTKKEEEKTDQSCRKKPIDCHYFNLYNKPPLSHIDYPYVARLIKPAKPFMQIDDKKNMAKIDYNWNMNKSTETSEIGEEESLEGLAPELPNRKNLQLPRRFFHMAMGITIATLYWFTFTHQGAIHTLGLFACLLYVMEQIRINYPEMSNKFLPITKFFMRAEEQLKESAMVPYVFAVLLTIITFPKPLALIAIYTLAIADPLSAIVGIKFGKRRIVSHKSLEGSLAFFISTFLIALGIFSLTLGGSSLTALSISFLLAFLASAFEMIPFKLDDNLTIPLFTATMSWALCASFGINL
ncbi:MAG: diacylglycerol/polyprenol kinase family protein [Bacteriovoracaceae bacterium]